MYLLDIRSLSAESLLTSLLITADAASAERLDDVRPCCCGHSSSSRDTYLLEENEKALVIGKMAEWNGMVA